MSRRWAALLGAVLPMVCMADLPALSWPPLTQVQPVQLTWFGAPVHAQLAVIPLPVAQALDALIAAAPAPWQVTVSGGRVVLAPLDDAWRLALTAHGDRTVAVLSRLDIAAAQATAAPAWVGAGWVVRARVEQGRARQWVLTHARAPGQLRPSVMRELRRAGWAQLDPVSDAVSRWHRGTDRMLMVLVATDTGSGLYVQEEAR